MAALSETARTIRRARLLASQPEEVFDALKEYGGDFFSRDEELEKLLLQRQDALVDLGLAMYSVNAGLVGTLYERTFVEPTDPVNGAYLRGLRVACLANDFGNCWPGGPNIQWAIGPEGLRRLARNGCWLELETLAKNPGVGPDYLKSLYRRDDPFSAIPDDRWLNIVAFGAENEIKKGTALPVLRLLEIAPTTPLAINCLKHLLVESGPEVLHYETRSEALLLETGHEAQLPKHDIGHLLERWNQVDDGAGRLADKEEFRCIIAAIYGTKIASLHATKMYGTREERRAPDDDIVRRCAFYGRGNLSLRDMEKGFARDSDRFLLAALFNRRLLDNAPLCKWLDEHVWGDLDQLFEKRLRQLGIGRRRLPPHRESFRERMSRWKFNGEVLFWEVWFFFFFFAVFMGVVALLLQWITGFFR